MRPGVLGGALRKKAWDLEALFTGVYTHKSTDNKGTCPKLMLLHSKAFPSGCSPGIYTLRLSFIVAQDGETPRRTKGIFLSHYMSAEGIRREGRVSFSQLTAYNISYGQL